MHVVDLYFVSNSQQTIECITKEVEIQDPTPLDDYDQPFPLHVGSSVNDESTDHVAPILKSILVSVKVMPKRNLGKV